MPTDAGTAPSRRSGMLANRKLSYQSFAAGASGASGFRSFRGFRGGRERSGEAGKVGSVQEIAYHWLAQPVLIVLVDCSERFTPAGSEV